jgi:carbon storage regulator CsrA
VLGLCITLTIVYRKLVPLHRYYVKYPECKDAADKISHPFTENLYPHSLNNGYSVQHASKQAKKGITMLVLSRKKDETIILKGPNMEDIRITVVRIDNRNKVRIGIEADKEITVLRSELTTEGIEVESLRSPVEQLSAESA